MRTLHSNELNDVAGGAHLPPTAAQPARVNSQDGKVVSARARNDVRGNPTVA